MSQIQALSLRRRSELFTVTRQVAPLNCLPGTKSAIIDCLVYGCDWYPLPTTSRRPANGTISRVNLAEVSSSRVQPET